MTLNAVFVIWRELFEAILIVTIVHQFLARRLVKGQALRLAASGIAIGIGLSVALGFAFHAAQTGLTGDALEHFQTAALVACAALMTHMVIWMQKHARHLKRGLEAELDAALGKASGLAAVGLIAFALAREGFEVVVFLYGMLIGAGEGGASAVAWSSASGAALAGLSAWALQHGLKFVNQRRFFQVTSAFLLLTASSMVLAAVLRLLQSGAISPLVDVVWDTSAVLDDRAGIGAFVASVTGYQATPALISVLIYAGYWMIYALLKKRSLAAPALAAACLAGLLASEASAQEKLKTKLSGYGDMQAAYYDHGRNRTLKNGAAKDARATFDTTRFVARLEGFYLPYDVEFEAEVEIEHGGSGGAMELEYEESGEFEAEIEKGGEVQLEEFYIKKAIGTELLLTVGRQPVAVGLVSRYQSPLAYLGVRRSEAETHIIPESWTEIGFGAAYDGGMVKAEAQVVNGLDSTGFNSEFWVSTGHQGRFEEISATDMAGVARLDILGPGGLTAGVSGYYGGTTRNRPQPDMVRICDKSTDDKVAACGWIDAPVTIADAHGTLTGEALRVAGSVVWGKLKNAGKLSDRNGRLPNQLAVARTPVADEAIGSWLEAGYDVGPLIGMRDAARLEPYVRYERYDTMWKVKSGQVDNPRFERRIAAVGVAYSLDSALFVKLDAARRTFGAKNLRAETTIALGGGFVY